MPETGTMRRTGSPGAWTLAGFTLALIIALSLLLHGVERRNVQEGADAYFDRRSEEIRASITHHLDEHEIMLRAGASLLSASHRVTADELRSFYAGLRTARSLIGTHGVGYLPVRGDTGDGAEGGNAQPLFDRFDPTTVIAIGSLSENAHRAALEYARDEMRVGFSIARRPTAADRDGERVAFAFFPHYRKDAPLTTREERRRALRGYVYSIQQIDAMFDAALETLREQIDIHIYDGPQIDDAALIYDTDGQRETIDVEQGVLRIARFDFGGRILTQVIESPPTYLQLQQSLHADTLLVAGLTIGLALAGLVWLLATRRSEAQHLATAMSTRARESERLLQFALERSGDGVWDWNLSADHLALTEHWRSLLGIDGQADTQPGARYLAALHPDDRARFQRRLIRHLRGKTAHFEVEARIAAGHRSERWILCRGKVVTRNAEGKATRMVGTCSDISAQKALQLRLTEAKEAAELANAAKTEFLSRMSHDLRTPMNAIIGFAQLMETEPGDPLSSGQQENLQQILAAAWRLLDLINKVLDLAEIEDGRLEMAVETLPLADQLAHCLRLAAVQAEKRGIVLIAPRIGAGDRVRADRRRLQQVLLNLLANAIDHSPDHGQIHVGCHPGEDGRLRIVVSDAGPDIPSAQQALLFQPFERRHAEGGGSGDTGIDLALSRRLIEAMNGRIGVDSEPGKGNRFWFELPGERAAADPPSP